LASSFSPDSPSLFLGDIVIARGVARRQARQARHSEAVELRVLALHGLLHLIGYDHERDDGRMRRVEQRLRRKGRLPQGLIERAGGSGAPARGRAGKR
jgi:probable rRNA maturation factor